jgi:hypothetical protein
MLANGRHDVTCCGTADSASQRLQQCALCIGSTVNCTDMVCDVTFDFFAEFCAGVVVGLTLWLGCAGFGLVTTGFCLLLTGASSFCKT